jgi:hypothetical protein
LLALHNGNNFNWTYAERGAKVSGTLGIKLSPAGLGQYIGRVHNPANDPRHAIITRVRRGDQAIFLGHVDRFGNDTLNVTMDKNTPELEAPFNRYEVEGKWYASIIQDDPSKPPPVYIGIQTDWEA